MKQRKKRSQFYNPFNLYRMIEGKKYQFMGLYPNKSELKLDLERIHNKYGYSLKFERSDFGTVKVWRRKFKNEQKHNHNLKR